MNVHTLEVADENFEHLMPKMPHGLIAVPVNFAVKNTYSAMRVLFP